MTASTRRRLADATTVAGMALIVCYFLLPYLRVTFLGRDEALYAYFAERAPGIALYRDFWDTHFPALYYLYALVFHLSGQQGMVSIRILLIIVQILGGIAFYTLVRRFLRPSFARVCAIAYAAFAVSPILEGNVANNEPFILPFAFAALAILGAGRRRWPDFAAGVLLGVASLFKQYFAAFLLVPLIATACAGGGDLRSRLATAARRIPMIAAGCLVPLVAMGIVLARYGLLDDLFSCTVTFLVRDRMHDVGIFTRAHDTYRLWRILPSGHPFLVAGALAGIALARRTRGPESMQASPRTRESAVGLVVWLAVATIMVVGGERAYPHYLELVAPPLCALGLLAIQAFWDARSRAECFAALFALAGLLAIDIGTAAMRIVPFYAVGKPVEVPPELVSAIPVGEYIRQRTDPTQSILVWGPAPAIYHYAERSAPTRFVNLIAVARPYIGASGDRSLPGAMEELRRDIDRNPPSYIVLVPTMPSFDIEQAHFAWMKALLAKDYVPDRSFGEDYRLYRRVASGR